MIHLMKKIMNMIFVRNVFGNMILFRLITLIIPVVLIAIH